MTDSFHTRTLASYKDIRERAMLVSLNISRWGGTMIDRAATDEVHANHKASADAGRYQKVLIDPKSPTFAGLKAIAGEARTYHYRMTLPWADSGSRIIPVKAYDEYASRMRRFRQDFERGADQMERQYPSLVKARASRLGSLFNQSDYPSAREIRDRYKFEVTASELPSDEQFKDFRIPNLSGAAVRELAKAQGKRQSQAVVDMNRAAWDRVYEVVSHMASKLADYDPKKKGKSPFRDSLVENAGDLADLLPVLNIADDKRLDDMAKAIKEKLTQHDADTLRKDDATREQVKDDAQDLLSKLAAYGMDGPSK